MADPDPSLVLSERSDQSLIQSGWVGSAIFDLGLGLEKNLFGLGQKSTRVEDRSASYLLQVKNMFGSDQGPSLIWTMIYLTSKYIFNLELLDVILRSLFEKKI